MSLIAVLMVALGLHMFYGTGVRLKNNSGLKAYSSDPQPYTLNPRPLALKFLAYRLQVCNVLDISQALGFSTRYC